MHGLRVGITADRKGRELHDALTRRGADVCWGPTLRVLPPDRDDLLIAETDALLAAQPSHLVVSTATGLAAWLDALDVGRHAAVGDLLRVTPVAARGAKAAGGLRTVGVQPVFVSPRETTEDVVAWLVPHVEAGAAVAVQVHGGEALGSLDPLRRRGVAVHTVAPYRWALPCDLEPARTLVGRLASGSLDLLACTSAPAVRHLFTVATSVGLADSVRASLRSRVAAAAVGPVTAAAFEEEGVPVAVMPTRARTGDLVRAVAGFAARRESVDGPLELVPSARAVRFGARVVVLGAQEFDVLAALVRRPGVVCRPGTLALAAFGHAMPADATAVRHHVSRIRRKLGPYADRVETVRGVGYRYRPSD